MKILLTLFLFVSFLFPAVDINSAGEDDFTALVGVGVKKSKDIVSFREKNGCFNPAFNIKTFLYNFR